MAASLCAASGLGAVALGAGLAGPASAATASRVVVGTVATPGTTSFTIKRGVATITVEVGTATTYVDRGVSAPTIADVTAGESVLVRGTLGGTDVVDATRVQVLAALPVVVGKVASVASLSSGSFTLTRGVATITVDVTAGTTYLDRGTSSATAASLVVGERVAVFGAVSGTDTVDATEVRVVPARWRLDRRPGSHRGRIGR